MKSSYTISKALSKQKGLSYVEVLLSMIIIAVAIVPAIESLRTGMNSSIVHEEIITDRYTLLSKMNELQSLQFDDLVSAANTAGSHTVPSEYSDAQGEPSRRLVYLSFYDAEDSDLDGNVFTLLDSNLDLDNNVYTVSSSEPPISMLWVSVMLENSDASLETLLMR